MTEKSERIAKVMAASGLCSRRDAEAWIEEGRVSVNGKKLTSPAFTVTDKDKILVDGKPLKQKERLRLWLYHKPPGLVTTSRDPQGRETVFDDLPKSMGRVISVGRLDLNSEGLLLLTNNGEFSRHLELPKNALERYYQVRIYGHVYDEDLKKLEKGVTVEGVQYKGLRAELDDPDSTAQNRWVHIVLTEGKNREIRRILQSMGLHVNRLIRAGYGPFKLGDLERGEVMEVPEKQLLRFCDEIGFKA